jgi:glucokinase
MAGRNEGIPVRIATLDIGGTAIKYCLYDDRFPLTQTEVCETPTDARFGGKALMEKVQALIEDMGSLDAIAVSTAGQIDVDHGTVVYATGNIPQYTGTPIRELLEECFHVPVTVENDVNAAALGEAIAGAGREYDSFLCLTYGTGIGGAIILDRAVYHGAAFSAGEMGHIVTHAGGLPCTCGNQGCYESYASTTALVRMVKESTGMNLNGREIFNRLDDSRVMQAVIAWIQEIMWGLVSLIHVFNPPAVILGGGIMNEDFICGYIREHIRQFLMPNYRSVQIRKAELGNLAGLQGVITLAKEAAKKI